MEFLDDDYIVTRLSPTDFDVWREGMPAPYEVHFESGNYTCT